MDTPSELNYMLLAFLFCSSLLVTFTAHPNVNFPNLGMQDLYGLIDKPADVVWQDDRCNRKQPQQSQSPASVRSFLVKKWIKSGFSKMEMSWFRHSYATFGPSFSFIPINEV